MCNVYPVTQLGHRDRTGAQAFRVILGTHPGIQAGRSALQVASLRPFSLVCAASRRRAGARRTSHTHVCAGGSQNNLQETHGAQDEWRSSRSESSFAACS